MPDAFGRNVLLQVGPVLLALAASGCGRVPRFEVEHGEPGPGRYRPPGSIHWDVTFEGAGETDASGTGDETGYSRFTARQLTPGAGLASETPAGVELLEWLFDDEIPLDIEPYLEYLRRMSFAEMVRAALASIKIPLGRNTTAELSVGLSAAGGIEFPGAGASGPLGGGDAGEWPEEGTERLADVFDQLESVFVGVDIPLPGRIRSRLAVDLYYGWEAEVDPDAPEIEPSTWTLDVKYRAWFW